MQGGDRAVLGAESPRSRLGRGGFLCGLSPWLVGGIFTWSLLRVLDPSSEDTSQVNWGPP